MPQDDWRKDLDSADDWRAGLDVLPKTGTKGAPPAPGEIDPLKTMLGIGSNVLGGGTAGAQLGVLTSPLTGPVGPVAGSIIGGALSAFLPPSEAPVADIGSTAADLIASRVLPGGLNTGRRLARVAGLTGGPALGALIGAQGDKALGYQKDTPWGRIGIYSAISAPGAILGSLASEASPVMEAARRLKEAYGIEIPLTFSQMTGRFPGAEQQLLAGTTALANMALEQDKAYQKAVKLILGKPLNETLDAVIQSTPLGREVRSEIVRPWVKSWYKANEVPVDIRTVTGGTGFAANPIVTTTQKMTNPKTLDWKDFDKFFGLTSIERDGFFRALKVAPGQFVDQFLLKGENQTEGLLRLAGVMKVLDKSGYSNQAGDLGQAIVLRMLRAPSERGEVANGAQIARRIKDSLGTDKTPGMLEVAIGPERAEALEDLATVLEKANPLMEKAPGTSLQKRAGTYAFNKIFFRAAEAGALAGAAGSYATGNLGTMMIGASGGAVVGIGLTTALGALMAKPVLGKLLIAASKGDVAAANRFLRTLASAKMSADERNEPFQLESPITRLEGLFKKK